MSHGQRAPINPAPHELIHTEATPLDQHAAAVYLARLGSRRSQQTMRAALNVVAQLLGVPQSHGADGRESTYLRCNWPQLRYQHTAALRALLMQRYEPATANVKIAALRGVLEEAWRLGQMSAEQYQRASDIKSIRATPLLRGRALSAEELAALLDACGADGSAFGRRDGAVIAVMYSTTMRRSEVAGLQLRDYSARDRSLKVLKGKGRKDRLVYLEDGAQALLEEWLTLRSHAPGPLFCHIKERGRKDATGQANKTYTIKPERGLTDQALYNLLAKRREQAGVDHFTPHDVRRTGISDLLDAGVDVVTVSHISGHASTDMVKRYDRRGEKAKQQAVQRLRVPARRKPASDSSG